MKLVLIILSLLVSAETSFAQNDTFLLVKTYTGDIVSAAMDNLDNFYIVSSTGQIKKFNANGDSIGLYNQSRNFGKLHSIDVSNPLKLVLFYKDFTSIVILDRFLANQASLDLKKISIFQPAAVGLSYDNNIWVYDEYDNKLKKINEQGNKLLETSDFRIAFNEAISPQRIISDNNLVYLADSINGVFVFDNYGTFKKRIPLKSWQTITVFNNNIVSTNREFITILNSSTQIQSQKRFPFFKPYFHSFITPTRLINYSSNTVQIYQYRF